MFNKENWIPILLIFTLTLSILPYTVSATNLDNTNTSLSYNNGSFYVDDLSKISTKIISKEVKSWIKDHTNINPNNFRFELIKDKKLNNNSNVIKFYDKSNHELYYVLTPGTTTTESNYENAKNTSLPLSISTHFSIVNGLQVTTSQVEVTLSNGGGYTNKG